ncbi:hypothetical protein RRG08_012694 [Elysia crispata]|uniref:Uncharacterized protein n=1 Tax=Elysia crispata TaxID=231223 RepID=A0AAE1D233_9GAST|nr:hypothetical protein RRG08_012694 [Elysia crispata]
MAHDERRKATGLRGGGGLKKGSELEDDSSGSQLPRSNTNMICRLWLSAIDCLNPDPSWGSYKGTDCLRRMSSQQENRSKRQNVAA